MARLGIALICASFAGCADFMLAPGEVSTPVPTTVKREPPVANRAKLDPPATAPVKAEPPVNAESRQMYQQALESLQQAIRLNPDRAVYYNELGMVSRREGRFDEARSYYAKALALDPNYAYAHLNIGILYDLYLQDTAKAMQHYQRYRELMPSEAGTVTKWIADLQQRGRATEQAKGGKSG